MRILCTSDWQADYENLDLCKQAAEEILQLKGELGFEVLVVCGDLKHVYNPVDVRVITFWQRSISKWIKSGLEVVVSLGNHDRIGMHVDKTNWFPVLRKAGALAYDEICLASAGDGQTIAVLPFRSNPVLLRREADDLSRLVGDRKPVLLFHSDLASAKYNVLTRSEGNGFSVRDLHPERYLFCVGGHIHFQQKVEGNVWYTGSPFVTDWGEANQRKGYLLVDTDKKSIRRVYSVAPGWYDPQWPGFEEAKPESWKGTKVRIKVPVTGVQHVREKLSDAETKAARIYVGADIIVVPEFNRGSEERTEKISNSFPDEKKIRIYVQETLPDELKKYEQRIQKYLIEQLAQVGGLQRENGELRFKGFRCRNFLSYDSLEFAFEPGLCIVTGENRDWGNRSNGAGKSSFLQPIAVAHSGQTFKDQKHDHWKRRGVDGQECFVKLWFDDAQERASFILRSREPKTLKLKVGGEVIESGNRMDSTQKLIEQVTGYTWETLSNAIYVDQTRSHLMLTGTPAERKTFLARLQNLERFERAYKAVSEQKTDFDARYSLNLTALESISRAQNDLLETISQIQNTLALSSESIVRCEELKERYRSARSRLVDWNARASKESAKFEESIEANRLARETYLERRAKDETRLEELRTRLKKFKKLEGECPTCQQKVTGEYIGRHVDEVAESVRHLEKGLEVYDDLLKKSDKKIRELIGEKEKWSFNEKLDEEVTTLLVRLQTAQAEVEQFKKQEELLTSLRTKLKEQKREQHELEEKKSKLGKWLKVLKYAHAVFKRDGLPAYLNAEICPELNQAAQEYSELFSQNEISVRFAVDEEGQLDVVVINAHGGEGVNDQSEGEMKMASLITSFAVRAVAPKTNVLILDEPGDGLDSVSARAFARGLKKVSGRYECILLTTHNPAILSELSDARLVTVVKEKGISRLEES